MSAMVFLPPTRCRDDEQRAPFAQVRLAASVLVRVEALVAKGGFSRVVFVDSRLLRSRRRMSLAADSGCADQSRNTDL